MKKLNQNIDDLFNQNPAVDNDLTAKAVKLNRLKKKRSSILDELQNTGDRVAEAEAKQNYSGENLEAVEDDDIVVPESLASIQAATVIEKIKEETSKTNLKLSKAVKLSKSKKVDLPPDIKQEINKQEIARVQQLTGKEIPQDFDIVEAEAAIEDINADIAEDFDIEDFEIKEVQKKTKAGYKKTICNIKSVGFPKMINAIATNVNRLSKNAISPRKIDVRVIANTNKTQLKNDTLKLSPYSIVFKPDSKVLKVKKYTRIIISVPANHDATGNLLIYMQESRSKLIFEINRNEFTTEEAYIDFISDRIAEYYTIGFEVAKRKLTLRSVNNPLMQVITDILRTGEYKARPYQDDSNKIYMVDFVSKGTKNQWLTVRLQEAKIPGTYELRLINNVDAGWERIVASKAPLTVQVLIEKLYDVLTRAYSLTYDDVENSQEDKDIYQLGKLTYKFLRSAFNEICMLRDEKEELKIQIGGTLSQKDTASSGKDYAAEAIVGKTDDLDYFILTYLAIQIKGGDKRNGADFITKQDYYNKYAVEDKNQYQKRKNTILVKEGREQNGTVRNYNSRPYFFQLEYSINSMKYKVKAKTFAEIMELTQFLTDSPIPPKK